MKSTFLERFTIPFAFCMAALALLVGVGIGNWLNTSDYVQRFGLAQFLFGPLGHILTCYFGFVVLRRGLFGLLNPFCAILIGFEVFLITGPMLLPQWAYDFYNSPERIVAVWAAVVASLLSFIIGYRLYL